MELFVETRGEIMDITDLVKDLSWTDPLNDGAGYLEFSYILDESVGLIERGAPVRLSDNDQTQGIAYGICFKVTANQNKIITVKSYDRLRYFKAKDTIVTEGDTLNTLVKKAAAFFGFQIGENTQTGYVLPDAVNTDKSWLDIIYTGISDTLIGTENYYCLRDENGELCLSDMADLQLPIVLGDNSLAYGYDYSASIDDEFYNQIKLVSANESTGHADVYQVSDSNSIEQYGLLQYYEVLDNNANKAAAKSKADNLLRLYNREVESLTLSCLGNISVRAGCSIYGDIADIGLGRRLIVRKVTHKFLPVYTMSVEVMI